MAKNTNDLQEIEARGDCAKTAIALRRWLNAPQSATLSSEHGQVYLNLSAKDPGMVTARTIFMEAVIEIADALERRARGE